MSYKEISKPFNSMQFCTQSALLKKLLLVAFLMSYLGFSAAGQEKKGQKSISEVDYSKKIFKPNDRVMFLGNSITHGGRYHNYIWLYYMTRFPNLRFTILNGGVGGDIIANINNRLEEDIFSKKPNIINLSFGMNDSGYFQYMMADPAKVSDKLFYQCDSAFRLVEAKLKAHPEIQKILMSGSPYDLNTKIIKNNVFPAKPATFERIVKLQENAAKANNWNYIDIYHPMDLLNKKYQQRDTNFTLSGSGDRIHPESYGHLVWAYLYLKDQGLKGVPVADFAVDAKGKKALAQVNCTISNIKGDKNSISFDYLAKALPFPIDETKHNGDKQTAAFALTLIPFMEDLNQEIVKVKNLSAGKYNLLIDGQSVGSFNSEELVKGVNLAAIKTTPQYLQAMEILKKNEERGAAERETRDYAVQVYNFARPNGITNDNSPESWAKMRDLKKTNGWINNDFYEKASAPAYRKALQDKMDKLTDEIYSMNKPVKHQIKLVKSN
ncbi:SGNH/GDSL hydrolase family protein [Pedobacter sandarakinus]|uniref:SGNH/GDSL hydrolase family protein n=1 Tax=Pedobacter sandarakinus TaxID=353156 RepID=UPI002247D176|nr:SGNH/GDSL hydrolase family protein [Pedobacter sandarakinus]MCX2574103.1 SGNH/GDSL hydrolase family protein [Pedobacter sandarakinus]